MPLSLHDRVLALWKLCVSFGKRDWELHDYPVVVREQGVEPVVPGSRLKPQRYCASIVNWGLAGLGDSEQDAIHKLENVFADLKAERKRTGQRLPRPGTAVPVQFAATERVDAHSELAADFIQRVLETDWAWISDESSLWDFHTNETNEEHIAKIREVYGVEVSDIPSARLCDIFDRIVSRNVSSL